MNAKEITLALIQRGYLVTWENCGAGWCIGVRDFQAPGRYAWISPSDGPYGHTESETVEPYDRLLLCIYTDEEDGNHFSGTWWNAEGKKEEFTEFAPAEVLAITKQAMTAELQPIN